MMARPPDFPPLMYGEAVGEDPFVEACARAASGCDAGLITYRLRSDDMQAALVLAPEVPLAQAMAMHPLCGIGLQNALGALSPPEVAVHLDWDGTFRVNGGICGRIRAAAGPANPVPDWLVVAFDLALLPPNDRPGDTPETTSLYDEGCGGIAPQDLISAWARHSLHWLHRWESDGPRALHAEWQHLLYDRGQGEKIAVDENFGLLQRDGTGTRVTPLTTLLEAS